MLQVSWQDFAGEVGDAPFIRKGQFARQFLDGHPSHVHGLLVGIVLDGELTAGGPQQVVMDRLVHPVPADGEPVVDAAQRGEDASLDAGFFGDLPDSRFLVVFLALWMALWEAPFQASAAVKAGDDRDP